MLSAFVLRSGAYGAVVRGQAPQRVLTALQSRNQSSATKQMETWDKANDIFYGAERDKVNFPHPVQPEKSGKVRLGFVPEEWFQYFYPRTGVTGPYLFGAGLVTFLLSKEIWVIDHGFSEVIGFWGAFIVISKKWGHKLGEFLDKQNEAIAEEFYVKPVEDARKGYDKVISQSETAIWQEEGQKYLFEAKKENVDLQLEAIYRQRLKTVYDEVKKRLDYQLELQTVKTRFEQDHMVNWIVNNVKKSITPQQEKESITKCIADLRGLSQA